MNIADIFMLCIAAPFALAGICRALFIGLILICLVFGIVTVIREWWREYWTDKATELDEGDKWKK